MASNSPGINRIRSLGVSALALGAAVALTLSLSTSWDALAQQPGDSSKAATKTATGKAAKQKRPKSDPSSWKLKPGWKRTADGKLLVDGKKYDHPGDVPAKKGPGKEYPDDPGVSVPVPDARPLPKSAMTLRYKFDGPVSYLVRSTSRLAVRDREDMKQVYTSALVVSYTPVEDGKLPDLAWRGPDVKKVARSDKNSIRVLLETRQAVGQFKKPALFGETERTHQILRQAHLSYLLDPRGKVSDVRVHVPTNPLSRSSLAQVTRMAELMQPVFPERPIEPGATWTQKIAYRDSEGIAQFSEDAVNTYKFERWTRCRQTVCAMIKITQDMKSAGRMRWRTSETQGVSMGGGEGLLLFDPHAGQVVKTLWKLQGQGQVKALQTTGKTKKDGKPEVKESATAELIVEVESTAERIER